MTQKIKKSQIVIEVFNCEQCPNLYTQRHYTPDPFEMEYDWTCKVNSKEIRNSVGWNEGIRIKIPEWCPCKKGD